MSDAYYRERAARRSRLLWAVGLLVLIFLCLFFGTRSLFYDACTGSFDRSPRAVIKTFVEAVRRGDVARAQECWEHDAYYDLEAGCSEICLSKVFGAQYQLLDLTVGEPRTSQGRARLEATVTVACTGSGAEHGAEILLDGVASDVPWRHWAIIRSTFGGTVADPWCKE